MERVFYAENMTSDSDDALSWDGDEGATPRDTAPRKARPTAGRAAEPAAPATASEPEAADVDSAEAPDDERPGLSTAMLLVLGVVGGIYLLYSVGWVVGGLRLKPLANLIVADAMYLPWFVLAIAAPGLWFLAVWVLTRGKAAWTRVGLLLVGVVLLVPWPFVTVGVVGS